VNYYNEFDPAAASWLKELMQEGLIPQGDIDQRDIREVSPSDLKSYTQCHFFAGIGGWSLALRLAGWSEDRPVWTGSCPCQPFSQAGKKKGEKDQRHLWPDFKRLITGQSELPVTFGEQVASPSGRLWLGRVRTDLEALGYSVGAADLCAAGVASPHIRQRLYWVADANGGKPWNGHIQPSREHGQQSQDGGAADGLRHALREGLAAVGTEQTGACPEDGRSFWSDSRIIFCRDGKYRRIPVEPTLFPLANGVSGRMGLLRGAGNAIVPQIAAEFIASYLDCT
jgi:DNA (cytosine-5)-methyltransferase 1